MDSLVKGLTASLNMLSMPCTKAGFHWLWSACTEAQMYSASGPQLFLYTFDEDSVKIDFAFKVLVCTFLSEGRTIVQPITSIPHY